MKKVVVIGGGAAGMMAAIAASSEGAEVTLVEKNEKTGKKIYITGKGRCNLTNACDPEDFFRNIISNPKFMYSAFYGFDNNAVVDMFNSAGCETKVERGQRVFPVSDHSSDVISALNQLMKSNGVKVLLNTVVTSIGDHRVYTNKGSFEFDRVIIATGGLSYPSTGSTGDGYKFAEDIGHTVNTPSCGLVPFETFEDDPIRMQGISLKNVRVKLLSDNKKMYEEFGEMLFTHFGISGPLVLSASSFYKKCKNKDDVYLSIDLKPALSFEELDDRLLRDFKEIQNKQFKNAFDKLLPQKMIPVLLERTGIDENKRINEITRDERHLMVSLLKDYRLRIKGTRNFNEAIITQGGINVKEVNPSTMESKICPGVYFAGEVLDVDALTGGFNLQVAWSTGYLAGLCAATE